jgi:phosphatidylglycerol:prolipoprotein diacylglycerol transferase
MFPVFFSQPPFTFFTLGFLMLFAFLSVGFVLWRKGKEEHYEEEKVMDVYFLSAILGLVVSRVAYIVLHWSKFGLQPMKWIDIFSAPGMLPLFGLIAVVWFLFRRSAREKWDAFEVLDFAALSVSFGMAILWLGAFLDGFGFGNPTNLPWGMSFPGVFDKRHPTQLYAFGLYLLLFLYLGWVEYRYRTFSWYRDRKDSAQTGFLFCVFLIFYGLFGMVLAWLMPPTFVIQGIALDLPIKLVIFCIGVLLLYVRSGRYLPFTKK